MLSVVTVTYNNSVGLKSTLTSLSCLRTKPFEVIVIDGASKDDTTEIVGEFSGVLNLKYITEPDAGIYDAMNKGHRLASGVLVHYLNAGDKVTGDPYKDLTEPCLIPVKYLGDMDEDLGMAKLGVFSHSYCHQGVIFPVGHPLYDTQYSISSDFDLLIKVFPSGLSSLLVVNNGYSIYDLCGISSNRRFERDLQITKILWRNVSKYKAVAFCALFMFKLLIPKMLRRKLRVLFFY